MRKKFFIYLLIGIIIYLGWTIIFTKPQLRQYENILAPAISTISLLILIVVHQKNKHNEL